MTDPKPLRVGHRLTLGNDVPCHRCKMTGKVRAPAMGKAEKEQRRRDNLIRASRRMPLLPRPPSTVDCPLCRGLGTLPRGAEVNDADPIPWEL